MAWASNRSSRSRPTAWTRLTTRAKSARRARIGEADRSSIPLPPFEQSEKGWRGLRIVRAEAGQVSTLDQRTATERSVGQSHSRRPADNQNSLGRVAEWLKAHDWKSCGFTPAWVRIPPRPFEIEREIEPSGQVWLRNRSSQRSSAERADSTSGDELSASAVQSHPTRF